MFPPLFFEKVKEAADVLSCFQVPAKEGSFEVYLSEAEATARMKFLIQHYGLERVEF